MMLSDDEFNKELNKHPEWTTITITVIGEYPTDFKVGSTSKLEWSGDLVEIGDPRHTIVRGYYNYGSFYTKEKQIVVAIKSTNPQVIPKIVEFVKTQGPKPKTDNTDLGDFNVDGLDDEDEFGFVWQEWTPDEILQGINYYLGDIGAWDKAKELGHF